MGELIFIKQNGAMGVVRPPIKARLCPRLHSMADTKCGCSKSASLLPGGSLEYYNRIVIVPVRIRARLGLLDVSETWDLIPTVFWSGVKHSLLGGAKSPAQAGTERELSYDVFLASRVLTSVPMITVPSIDGSAQGRVAPFLLCSSDSRSSGGCNFSVTMAELSERSESWMASRYGAVCCSGTQPRLRGEGASGPRMRSLCF